MTVPHPNTMRVVPSILDRLIAGPYKGVIGTFRQDSAEALRQAVQRDLDDLLNTRREEQLLPPAYHEAASSLLNFGLPDFTVYNLRSTSEQHRLRKAIETAVRVFEPRLANVSVFLDGWDELKPVLRYRLEALLKIDPAPEAVVFETEFKADTRRFAVKANSDER
jgi:type VI secretion system protein ImpF